MVRILFFIGLYIRKLRKFHIHLPPSTSLYMSSDTKTVRLEFSVAPQIGYLSSGFRFVNEVLAFSGIPNRSTVPSWCRYITRHSDMLRICSKTSSMYNNSNFSAQAKKSFELFGSVSNMHHILRECRVRRCIKVHWIFRMLGSAVGIQRSF